MQKIVSARKGNYMVFLPSYQYLKEIEEILEEGSGLKQGVYLHVPGIPHERAGERGVS